MSTVIWTIVHLPIDGNGLGGGMYVLFQMLGICCFFYLSEMNIEEILPQCQMVTTELLIFLVGTGIQGITCSNSPCLVFNKI